MNGPKRIVDRAPGRGFVPPEFLPDGEDEHYLRRRQERVPAAGWRRLRAREVEALVRNGNACDDWDDLLVSDPFNPHRVRNNEFYGLVRLGAIDDDLLEHHELEVPTGITNSRIIACDVGDGAAIHNVRYLARYLVADGCILLNLDEMHTTNHAKFGNGIVKDGEDEAVRVWIDPVNEAGGRSVLPFDGIISADAALWATCREDPQLLDRLRDMTQQRFDPRRGLYGQVGAGCVIKNCRVIKDVNFGPFAYVKGANKLKNLTIDSTRERPTQIGEGVELVNGVIAPGCRVFYGCKAVRFVMGAGSSLKYGARLVHSLLGDNSTVSCCEILNNLIFPAHEQHHNNSFLIASLVMGQSNIAAGATIGSNHNSRAPDGEIHAGRGFWPGLCVSIKHNSRFASFTLLAKGDYPAELDVPLPFSLVGNDVAADRLVILPAYWWMYNTYALARNSWKFRARDERIDPVQNVEFDYLAPDTVEEILRAASLLERWAGANADEGSRRRSDERVRQAGRAALTSPDAPPDEIDLPARTVENSGRKVVILRAGQAYAAYREMLLYYAAKNLMDFADREKPDDLAALRKTLGGRRTTRWVNLGGQLVRGRDVDRLRADIRSGKLSGWDAVHAAYAKLWRRYPREKARHAYAVLRELLGTRSLSPKQWVETLERAKGVQRGVAERVASARRKDFENPFRRMVYDSDEQMTAVLGELEDNDFVRRIRRQTRAFIRRANRLKRLSS